MSDYIARPDYEGWTYESVDVARQRLVWYLSTHSIDKGTINHGKKRVGTIQRDGNQWFWYPVGKNKISKVNPANGRIY